MREILLTSQHMRSKCAKSQRRGKRAIWGTKWTSHDKEEASIAFLTGSRSRAAHMPPAAEPANACLSFARA